MPEEGGSATGREASEEAVTAVASEDCESIQYTHMVPARQAGSSGLTSG
jgi:hypothetical protein